MGYLEWNDAIFKHFYSQDTEDESTFLALDDEALVEIGRQIGITDDPSGNFIHYVQKQNEKNNHYGRMFEWYATVKDTWMYQESVFHGCPPFIGLLSLTVLAASRMNSQAGYSSSNYYIHLRELLGFRPNEEGKIKLDSFWVALDDFLKGWGFSQSTIRTHSKFVHIGYPLSQIFLRRADIQHFPEFFTWAHLSLEEIINDRILLDRFIDWANNSTCRLNNHFYKFIENNEFGMELSKNLLTILRKEHLKWVDAIQQQAPMPIIEIIPAVSSRVKPISIWFEENMGDYEFRLVAEYSGDAPPDAEVAHCIEGWGEVNGVEIGSMSQHIVIPIPSKKFLETFTSGISAHLGETRYRYSPTAVTVFGSSEWSGLASQSNLIFGKEHALLCQQQVANSVEAFLGQYAESGWVRDQIGKDLVLYQGVRIPFGIVIEIADDRLTSLVPKLQISVRWDGGVRLSRSIWLHNFEPTVVVETQIPQTINVQVDGIFLQTIRESRARISLQGRGLDAGHHTLVVGTHSFEFELEDLTREKPFSSSIAGGFVVNGSQIQYHQNITNDLLAAQVVIQGGLILNDRPNIVLLTPNSGHYVILGERPGEVYEYDPPYRLVEPIFIEVPFPPQWLITFGRKNRRYLHLVGQDCITAKPVTQKHAKGLRKWRYWINRTYINQQRAGEKFLHKGLWNAYRQLA